MWKYLLPSPGRREGIPKPKVCTHCNRCYLRIDVHKKYCNSENGSCAPVITVIEKDIETTRTNYGNVAVVEPNKRGSFMSISTEASDPIFNMKNATLLTPIQKKAHGLKDRSNFMYIHKNSEDFLNDFSDWLALCRLKSPEQTKQILRDVKKIWSTIDREMRIGKDNCLSKKSLLEAKFFAPLFKTMVRQSKNSLTLRSNNWHQATASTISSRLDHWAMLFQFMTAQDVFIGKHFLQTMYLKNYLLFSC